MPFTFGYKHLKKPGTLTSHLHRAPSLFDSHVLKILLHVCFSPQASAACNFWTDYNHFRRRSITYCRLMCFVSKEKKKDNQILGWKLTQLSSWLNWVLLSPSSFHLSKLIVTIFMQFSSHWNQVLQFSSYERAAAVIIQLACYVNHVMSDLHKYQHNILIPQPQSHTCTDLHTHSPSPTHPHNMSNDITFHLKCSQYNF